VVVVVEVPLVPEVPLVVPLVPLVPVVVVLVLLELVVLVVLVVADVLVVDVVLVSVPVVVVVVVGSGSGFGFSFGTGPTTASEVTLAESSGSVTFFALLGFAEEPSLESSPPLALPTANDAPNRTTAAPASASRVRAGFTHSPPCAASSSPGACRTSAP
jgi:hypothetical protein